jgi:hypothetical protein
MLAVLFTSLVIRQEPVQQVPDNSFTRTVVFSTNKSLKTLPARRELNQAIAGAKSSLLTWELIKVEPGFWMLIHPSTLRTPEDEVRDVIMSLLEKGGVSTLPIDRLTRSDATLLLNRYAGSGGIDDLYPAYKAAGAVVRLEPSVLVKVNNGNVKRNIMVRPLAGERDFFPKDAGSNVAKPFVPVEKVRTIVEVGSEVTAEVLSASYEMFSKRLAEESKFSKSRFESYYDSLFSSTLDKYNQTWNGLDERSLDSLPKAVQDKIRQTPGFERIGGSVPVVPYKRGFTLSISVTRPGEAPFTMSTFID